MIQQAEWLIDKYSPLLPNLGSEVYAQTRLFFEWGLSRKEAALATEACIIDMYKIQNATVDLDDCYDDTAELVAECSLSQRLGVDDGEIFLEVVDGDNLPIGKASKFYKLKEYDQGVYTTENGIEIVIEEYIEDMRVNEVSYMNIIRAPRQKAADHHKFTKRELQFNGVLFNRLRGRI